MTTNTRQHNDGKRPIEVRNAIAVFLRTTKLRGPAHSNRKKHAFQLIGRTTAAEGSVWRTPQNASSETREVLRVLKPVLSVFKGRSVAFYTPHEEGEGKHFGGDSSSRPRMRRERDSAERFRSSASATPSTPIVHHRTDRTVSTSSSSTAVFSAVVLHSSHSRSSLIIY